MVSGGVMLVFIIFAGVLAWADRQTPKLIDDAMIERAAG